MAGSGSLIGDGGGHAIVGMRTLAKFSLLLRLRMLVLRAQKIMMPMAGGQEVVALIPPSRYEVCDTHISCYGDVMVVHELQEMTSSMTNLLS
jgi:hypothetical protein